MAEKDKAEKVLEDYNDVFADIYNTLLFKEPFLDEKNLDFGPTESVYKAETGEMAEQRRDVQKSYNKNSLCIFSLGLENQETIDKLMPVRIMGYDYSTYRAMANNNNSIVPVVTIVLNFSDSRWNKPKNLLGMMENVPDELKPFIQDYEVKVFDIAYLDDEIIDSFSSDFKVVARFFKEKRLGTSGGIMTDNRIALKHVEAVLDLFHVFTRDSRYENASELIRSRVLKGDEIFMCSIAEAIERKGIEQGKEEGREEGLKALVQILKEFLPDFSSVYNAVIKQEVYRNVTEKQVRKYY